MRFMRYLVIGFLGCFLVVAGANAKEKSWSAMEYEMVGTCAASQYKDVLAEILGSPLNNEELKHVKFQSRIPSCLKLYDLPDYMIDQEKLILIFLVSQQTGAAQCVAWKLPVVTREQALESYRRTEMTAASLVALKKCNAALAASISMGNESAAFFFKMALVERQIWRIKITELWEESADMSRERRLAICSWKRSELWSKAFFIKSRRSADADLTGPLQAITPELIGRCSEFSNEVKIKKYLSEFFAIGAYMGGTS